MRGPRGCHRHGDETLILEAADVVFSMCFGSTIDYGSVEPAFANFIDIRA